MEVALDLDPGEDRQVIGRRDGERAGRCLAVDTAAGRVKTMPASSDVLGGTAHAGAGNLLETNSGAAAERAAVRVVGLLVVGHATSVTMDASPWRLWPTLTGANSVTP